MKRYSALRVLAGWALFASVLAGNVAPHSHPLLSGAGEESAADGRTSRVITDDASTNLRWHSILRVERDDCVACHAQRAGDLTRGPGLNAVCQKQEPVLVAPARAIRSCSRLPNPSRGPPTLL